MADDFVLEGSTGTLWHLWSRKYGAHTESGDAGYIKLRDDGYEAFSRGDMGTSQRGLSDARCGRNRVAWHLLTARG